MAYSLEYSILIQATSERLYSTYAEVDRWHLWDPDTRSASLDGPLAVGATGCLKPRKGMAVKMRVVTLVPGRRFEVECPVLGSVMHFDHRIEVVGDDTIRATHTVRFEGWLSGFLYRLVGKNLHQGLPDTLKKLKKYVEAGQGS